jgi:ATP-binding cassette subfamily B protein
VLDHLDFTVKAETTLGLVGPTASGKSTLISLLLRFYDPDSGAITLDQVDLRDLRFDDLRRRVGVVFQQPLLLADTVAANLSLFRPDATIHDLVHAAKAAGIHDTIAALPDGYDTVLGEVGRTLSGGQRQRLGLARSLVADPPLLLLDEPTAAVDARRERELASTLRPILKGRTTVLVTRRPVMLELTDEVAILEDGRIIETGTHAELAAHSARYRRLIGLTAESLT